MKNSSTVIVSSDKSDLQSTLTGDINEVPAGIATVLQRAEKTDNLSDVSDSALHIAIATGFAHMGDGSCGFDEAGEEHLLVEDEKRHHHGQQPQYDRNSVPLDFSI